MKAFTKACLYGLSTIFSLSTFAQINFWKNTTETNLKSLSASKSVLLQPTAFNSFTLDTVSIKNYLQKAPHEFTDAAAANTFKISMPMPNGSYSTFAIAETFIMEPRLAAKYAEIKTFKGRGIEDPTAFISLSWTYSGFNAIVYSATGTINITPYAVGCKTAYISYDTKNIVSRPYYEEVSKEVIEAGITTQIRNAKEQKAMAAACTGPQLYTYRFVLSCTGEYARALGYGAAITKAQVLSDFTNKLLAIDAIYENETSTRFVLVNNTDNVIFLDPATDPYSDQTNFSALLTENQNTVTSIIGSANYDFGINLCSVQSGVAYVSQVCINTGKALATSGYSNPLDPNYIQSICHEIGHQFSCPHSFNCNNGGGGTEPGTGATIMSYAGSAGGGCSAVYPISMPYFHTSSREYIYNFSRVGNGSLCAGIINTGNSAPVVTLPATAYSVPLSTPFTLTGAATDANGDALSYQWEEFDLGAGNTTADWNIPTGTDPLFRNFLPSALPVRTFPQLGDIVSGVATPGEFMANYARNINLRLTAKDNKGGICSADAVVTVTNNAPFKVTSQATATSWVANGVNTATITWDVSGTNAAPFNTSLVDIVLSVDGGYTFPYVLVLNTPNDGTQNIVIPNYNTPSAKVMVRSVNNIFFNLNLSSISINVAGCPAEAATIMPGTDVSAPAGNNALNLSLAPLYSGPEFTSVSGTFTTADTATFLTVQNTSGGCVGFSNPTYAKLINIIVSKTGSYSFTRTGPKNILNIYANAFYKNNPCQNLLLSSYIYGGAFSSNLTLNLTAGNKYVLAGEWWDQPSSDPTYGVAVTSTPVGGKVYLGNSIYTDPGAAYSYKYVIVNNATNNITAITTTPDLSNAAVYKGGENYTVYGLSFVSTISGSVSTYTGGPFTALTNRIATDPSTFCANLSKNKVAVTIKLATLPVTLINFTATKYSSEKAMLKWSTMFEQNTASFTIERADDGAAFTTIVGKVAAAGFSNTLKNYSLTDYKPLPGWNYYRLKQIDIDSRANYSEVKALNFISASTILIYPNPAENKLTVNYNTTKAAMVTFTIMDSKGALVKKMEMNVVAGDNSTVINVAGLSKGMYIFKSSDIEAGTIFKKFVKK